MKEEKILLDDNTIIIKIDLSQPEYINLKTKSWLNIPPGCRHCSNHPSNGGSGICHCTIGIQTTT